MIGNRTWWRWFSTNLRVNTAIVLFNAILIGLLWNAVFGLVRTERQNTIRAAIDRNDNLAIAFERYATRTLKTADAVTQYLVREYANSRTTADLVKFMADYPVDNNAIIGVVLADERGNAMTTAYSPYLAKRTDLADREHFRVHVERDSGRLFVGKPVAGRVTGKWIIPVTRRINKADGTFGGVAMALIEPARFTDVLHDAKLRPLDIVSLTGLDGITRARLSGTATSWGEDIGKSPLFAEQARDPVGNYFAKGVRDGIPRFFSYRTLPDYQMIATVGAAESDVMAEFHSVQKSYFWAAGLTSAIIAVFALLLMLALAKQRRGAASVAHSELRFRQMAENIHDVFFLRDAGGARMLYVSPAYEEIFGRTRESLYAHPESWSAAIHPDDRTSTSEKIAQGMLAEKFQFQYRIVRPDGSIRWIETRGFPVRDDAGRIARIAGIAKDITENKNAEFRIAHLNRVFAMLSGINTLIVHERDRDKLFRESCRIAVEEGGFCMSMIAIMDRNTKTLIPVASAGVDQELLTAVKVHLSTDGNAPGGETTFARVIREKKAAVSNVSPDNPAVMFGKKFAGSTAVLPLDVSNETIGVLALYALESEFFGEEELKLLADLAGNIAFAIDHLDKQDRLEYLAYYDVLTGLANRNLFLERVAQHMRAAVNGGHKLAVILIDLERFRNINDSLGRPAGDALLRQVGDWLSRNAGDASLMARVGSDLFAVVLPQIKVMGDVGHLLEKMMQAFLAHPFRLDGAVFRVATRVGVAIFPDDGSDAGTVFKHAEAALKKAKASGDRFLFYQSAMTAAVAGELSLENQLREAFDKDEFVLHYQPKINLDSGKLTGVEALLRWNDPRTGLVPPGRFIPVLEEIGLIHDVGRWALRQALADYLRWRSAGLPAVRIAVNVSPLQLRSRDFISEIRQALGIHAHAADGLELEITESLIMEDVKHNIASLLAIRAMGLTVAIDDFGTGFSSLSYLARLPVDSLKIDRSFVNEMTVTPQGLALVSTIINLAHSLKLKVVAEGVETEEQSRLLRLLRCDEMQGFLFCKPVPAQLFESRFLAPAEIVSL